MENAPSILFIDEIDGIAPKRKDASESAVQLTSEFLQEMDGFRETPGVVLVCATNRPSALDPAILRPGRFDKLIFVQPPDEAAQGIALQAVSEGCACRGGPGLSPSLRRRQKAIPART